MNKTILENTFRGSAVPDEKGVATGRGAYLQLR